MKYVLTLVPTRGTRESKGMRMWCCHDSTGHGSDTGEEKVGGMENPRIHLLWSRFVFIGLAPFAWSNMLG